MLSLGLGIMGLARSGGGDGTPAPALWTPDLLTSAQKTNGGWWSAEDQIVDSGRVTAWPDRWGVRDMAPNGGYYRPDEGTINGFPAAVWPDDINNRRLAPPADFAPAWFIMVLQYKDGLATTFDTYINLMADIGFVNRMTGETGSDRIYGTWDTTARLNGSNTQDNVILPLPLSLVSFDGDGTPPVSALWSIGGYKDGRGWQGPICEVMTLGETPSTDDRQKIEGYLAHKYNLAADLPADHPYRASPPTA